MGRYRAVVRVVFAVAFLGGALVHLYFGFFVPRIYAPFADTVLWSRLAELWRCFVMASIGWLSLHEGRQSWQRWGASPSSWFWATPGRRMGGGRIL